jgi:hypothetical protein
VANLANGIFGSTDIDGLGSSAGMNPWESPGIARRIAWLVHSHRLWTGRDLVPDADPAHLAERVWAAPFVVVSHGTEADPVLWYGNRTALGLWQMDWAEFTSTPSRFTAEAPEREERARLMAAVTARGFIDDYAGVRISRNGRRFRIHRATVWNVVDSEGRPAGQAATFAEWDWLN